MQNAAEQCALGLKLIQNTRPNRELHHAAEWYHFQ